MGAKYRVFNIRLSADVWDQLTRLALQQGLTRVDVVRAALDAHLACAAILSDSQRRLARLNEFQQLALDILIREQFPEYRERLLAETDKRMEQYHGA